MEVEGGGCCEGVEPGSGDLDGFGGSCCAGGEEEEEERGFAGGFEGGGWWEVEEGGGCYGGVCWRWLS